jgi:hypothetical protein
MSRYSLGFTISSDVVRLAVVEEKNFGWELKTFVKATTAAPAKDTATLRSFHDREKLIALLLQLYDSPEFAPYRKEIGEEKERMRVAVGIPGKFAWIHYIPFQSLNDLYNRKLYQQSVDEILRRDIPYPTELLAYDTRPVTDADRPYVYLLASPKKLLDDIVGTKELESVFEQVGFPNPALVVAEMQGLFTLYPIIAANKKETSIVVHLTAKYMELTILEGTRPCKNDNLSVPDFEAFPPDDQKFFFAIFVLIQLKMALMYGLWEGKAVQKVVLFGTPSFLSLEQIRDFLQEVLGRQPQEINREKIRHIFPHKNLDTLLKVCMERYTQSKMDIPEFSRVISSTLANQVIEKVIGKKIAGLSPEASGKTPGTAKMSGVEQANLHELKINLSGLKTVEEIGTTIDVTFKELLEAPEMFKEPVDTRALSPGVAKPGEGIERSFHEALIAQNPPIASAKEALNEHIYQKMIEKEKSICVEIIEPSVIRKFVSKGAREQFTPVAEHLVPMGLAVHALLASEQSPNLAQPLGEKRTSPVLQRVAHYLPELALNLLVIGALTYVGLLALYQQHVANQVKQVRLAQRQALEDISAASEESGKTADPIEWRKRSWNQLHVENANLTSAVQFPAVRANKVAWGEAIKEIAEVLPANAVVTSFTFEMGIDDISGEEVPLVHIHGHAPSAARVMEALNKKALSFKDIRLEAPVEPKAGEEAFVVVGKYWP